MDNKTLLTEDGPIYSGSYVELLRDSERCTVSKVFSDKEVELLEYPGELFLVSKDIKPVPDCYRVYFWNGYYIFAENKTRAAIVWNSWVETISSEVIEESSKHRIEDETCIKEYKRLKTQAPYPCITDSLDWEKPVYCYKK